MNRTLRTSLVFRDAISGTEHELDLVLRYALGDKGSDDFWDGQQWQQGWGAEADLVSAHILLEKDGEVAVPEWMFSLLFSDDSLRTELLADAAESDEYDEYARELAHENRREELREERT